MGVIGRKVKVDEVSRIPNTPGRGSHNRIG